MDLYKVKRLGDVDTTLYKDGDFFRTKRSLGILINGKIQTIPLKLDNYVTKKELEEKIKEGGTDG